MQRIASPVEEVGPGALWKATERSLQELHCPTPLTEKDTHKAPIKEIKESGDFPGSPVVKTLCIHGFDP